MLEDIFIDPRKYTIEDVLTLTERIEKKEPFVKFVEKENTYVVHISCFHCVFVYKAGMLAIVRDNPIQSCALKETISKPREFREYVRFINRGLNDNY